MNLKITRKQRELSPTCNSCAFKTQDGFHCSLTAWEIKPFEDSCFCHIRSITECGICHTPIIGTKYIEKINDKFHILCSKCNAKMNTCELCDKGQECLFITDPSTLPKVVMKTVRQGNMVMQTQIRNPEREQIICPKCKCWINDECQKECGRCINFQHTW